MLALLESLYKIGSIVYYDGTGLPRLWRGEFIDCLPPYSSLPFIKGLIETPLNEQIFILSPPISELMTLRKLDIALSGSQIYLRNRARICTITFGEMTVEGDIHIGSKGLSIPLTEVPGHPEDCNMCGLCLFVCPMEYHMQGHPELIDMISTRHLTRAIAEKDFRLYRESAIACINCGNCKRICPLEHKKWYLTSLAKSLS